jgi:hypothetical protein
MERDQYYYGLNGSWLETWLVVINELAWYCEKYRKKYMRYNHLKANCNIALRQFEKTDLGGGNYESIINSGRYKEFFRVKKVKSKGKRETRIYPKIQAIQREVKGRQAQNLDYGNKRIIRIVHNIDTIHCPRPIVEPPVPISESLTRQTSKTRALRDSVSISERLNMVVTRANPNERSSR